MYASVRASNRTRNHVIEWEKGGGVIIYVRIEEQKWLVAEFVQWPASILSET